MQSFSPFSRGTDTGFGIQDLPQKSTIQAKTWPLGQIQELFMKMEKTCDKGKKMRCCRNISHFKIYLMASRYETMFFKIKISTTHNAAAWGLVRRDPEGFLILTTFRGTLGHLKFGHFYIVDFHSACAFLDRGL